MKSTLEQLERSMQRERITALTEYYAQGKDSEKTSPFFLRAVSKDGLMTAWQKESEIEAVELAKDYWLKGFVYVEVFCWRNKNIDIVYHGVRWGF